MNHKVNSVQDLYDDSKKLYDEVVVGKADSIINELKQTIDVLKNSWEGEDAGVQIENVVEVYNAMTKIRNALAVLSKDSSSVASDYREIQRSNRANLEGLTPITIDGEIPQLEPYSDKRDTIGITSEALNGKTKLDDVNSKYEDFKTNVRKYYDLIMENWQAGDGRDSADEAFAEFMNGADKYKSTLEDVSRSISDAIKNYEK